MCWILKIVSLGSLGKPTKRKPAYILGEKSTYRNDQIVKYQKYLRLSGTCISFHCGKAGGF